MKELLSSQKEKIKKLCTTLGDIQTIHEWLDNFYLRISNKNISEEISKKYNLMDIIKNSKQITSLEYKQSKNHSIIFELLSYSLAPQQFLLVYNEFGENNLQTSIDFYILK